tara:strand:- start:624 stop:752 length:129 start_codon:yes stop_codon:yes gene_type:complete
MGREKGRNRGGKYHITIITLSHIEKLPALSGREPNLEKKLLN